MKQYLLLFIACLLSIFLFSQGVPIANDDYVDVHLGEMLTINVVKNDIHPDNLNFKVYIAPSAHSFTDSTITYEIAYDIYYNNYDTIDFFYGIIDENGNVGDESFAKVFINIIDNNYYDFLDHNNIRAKIQASGLQFWPGPIEGEVAPNSVFEFPKGSETNTIFNSTLWVGGMDASDQLHIAAERYRQIGIDYWPGPISVNGSELSIEPSTVIEWQNTWKLTKDEVVFHKLHYWEEGYEPIANIASWPAHGDLNLNQSEYLAPFIDVDGDSIYNPLNGDYPLIRGEQCIYFIINDQREHTETGGEALGLEIHGMAYQFNDPESLPISNTVFFSYKIFNRSSVSYNDTYIGLFTDFDIGYGFDDYVGCDVGRGAYFGYNGDSIDGVGGSDSYGDNPPAQGMIILGGPLMDANGIDDADGECDESINGVGFGDDIVDNERYGMKKFLWFNNTNGVQGDPQEAYEYYNYLKSIWKDGTAMEYGGNGHVNSGAYGPSAEFMFPGISDPCYWGTNQEEPYGPIEWTEVTAESDPGDRRGLSVMGPFTFEAGTMERIDLAYVSAFKENEQTAVETLMDYVDAVKVEYYEDPTYFGYQWLDVEEIQNDAENIKIIAYPNPVNSDLSFAYYGEASTATYQLIDLMGKIILSGSLNRDEINTVEVSGLKAGIFFLSVRDSGNTYSTKIIKH